MPAVSGYLRTQISGALFLLQLMVLTEVFANDVNPIENSSSMAILLIELHLAWSLFCLDWKEEASF